MNPQFPKKLGKFLRIAFSKLGEYLDIGTSQAPFAYMGTLVSLVAVAIYLLSARDAGNDDDDSDSGSGGLMQPIS
ncbi:hypothetical protein [Prochlorococcus sp. MIT 1300]|uniref:hypothetical protein n=1 Tax=Prochlorococcus sp. MIT 1300 TaxID=3096218 RepID=UPI002A74C146|nr:hypothetical protein [Prochlorococcus sp. MIT 1300]